ncbi:MAG TPA: tetratricopeptide repeat protein [Bryobacterales bacterium]|nr:tetratricopeptide repeat protein [Bryobacterales bacterium]
MPRRLETSSAKSPDAGSLGNASAVFSKGFVIAIAARGLLSPNAVILAVLLLLFLPAAAAATGPPSAQAVKRFQDAVAQWKQGHPEAAEPVLKELCSEYPDEPAFQDALGTLYSLQRQPRLATPYLEQAARLKPSADANAKLAENYAELGRSREAEALFQKALALEPGNIGANMGLASLKMDRDAYAAAAPLLERVVRARPADPQPAYLLAVCYSSLGRAAQARRVLLNLPEKARDREEIQLLLGSASLALHRQDEARAYFERAFQRNPASVPAAANLGGLLVAAGELERGLKLLEAAWQSDHTSYLAGYNLALAYRTKGDFAAARNVLTSLLAQGEKAELYSLLGEVEIELRDGPAALDHLQRAVKLEPGEADLFELGYALLQFWKLNEAVEVLSRGTAQFPSSARLWMALGTAYFAQDRNQDAIDAYLRATQLGDDPRAYRFLAEVYQAANASRSDVAARFHHYRLTHPNDAWANLCDGYGLLRDGQPEKALPLLERAVQLAPGLAAAHFELGKLYSQQGRREEALRAYEAAVKADPGHPEAWYRLGQAYMRAGRREDAEKALARHEELRRQQAAGIEQRLRGAIELLNDSKRKQDQP